MPNPMSRRTLLTGIGAGGAAVAFGAAASPAAAAAPARRTPSAQAQRTNPLTPPALPAPIASPPEIGVTYRYVGWHDFAPEDSLTYGRRFGGSGAYSDVTADYLAAFIDIPAGALIHDVEFYLASSSDVTLFGITWVSGTGPYESPYWLQQTDPANSSMHASRFVVDPSVNGPFPFGTRIGVSLFTPTDASVQINGVRFGLLNAPMSTVLLPSPVRVYDSTAHSPLMGGQTRNISLSGQLPVGANAALYTINAFNTHNTGVLRAGPAGGSSVQALRWGSTGAMAANSVTSAVSANYKIAISSGASAGATDLYVDLVGYLV